jgi:hypothetical protein
MNKFQARQGDIFFRVLDKIPTKGLKKKTDGTLFFGEVTGHSHSLTTPISDCESYVNEHGDIYIRSANEILVGHDEHNTITLPSNEWICVSRQKEYDPLEKARRVVAD